jgi:hypothetical protein
MPNGLMAEKEVQGINITEGWPRGLLATNDDQDDESARLRLTPEQLDRAYTMAQSRYLNYFEPDQIGWNLGQPERPAGHPKPPFEIKVLIENVPANQETAIKESVMRQWPAAKSWERRDHLLVGSGTAILPYEDADPDALLNRILSAVLLL